MGKKRSVVDSSRPTTIFFIRHGRPDNPKGLIKGLAPFKLSEEGEKQVEGQAERLKGERIARIFTSPVRRCRQTAEIVASVLNKRAESLLRGGPAKGGDSSEVGRSAGLISELTGPGGVKVKTTTNLTEWASKFDGRPGKEARRVGKELYNAGFEPQGKVIKRMKEFVQMALIKFAGQKIVAVSHQGPIDLLILNCLGKDTDQAPWEGLTTGFAGIVRVDFDSEGKILKFERIPSL